MERTINQTLIQATDAHKKGKIQDAELLYKAILKSQPQHPDANHNLGLIAVSIKKINVALPLFKTALEANPKIEQFWFSYIDTLIKDHQIIEAKQVIEQAKKQGVVEKKLNILETQLSSIKELKDPSGMSPSQQQIDNLLELYQAGKYDDAEKLAASLTEKFPKHPFSWKVLGAVLKQIGKINEALILMQRSVQLFPQDGEAHNNLGSTLQDLGRLEEARQSYEQAIKLKPDFAEAHLALALIKKFNVKDEQYSKMLKIYLDKNTPEKQLYHINFGLAKVYEDLRDFKKAFEHYSEGNALRKKMLNYDINENVEQFNKIKLNYPSILKNSLKSENIEKNLIPIFIVGMPRSGTTLVEQIISSHLKVTGAGELPFVYQFGLALAKGSVDKSSDTLINFRNKYLAKLQNIAKGNLIVTDKMPYNYYFIGLITAAFPEAKIVHVKRNAAAVCWGIYKQCFQNKKIVFSYATKDIVNNYKLYQNIMKFWESSLKDKIYTLEYELLVENQERETRQLIDYLGLDWDEKCLSPQYNTRSVSTASNTQVRKKIYQGSSQQWKKYQPFLNGVFDGL